MGLEILNTNGLALLGCGKMGGAILEGWLSAGLHPGNVSVIDPYPSARLEALAGAGLHLNADLRANPAVCVIAVKPQMISEALARVEDISGPDTLFLSVAAGTTLSCFESTLGPARPIVRAMPNTPAAVGKGITALIGNKQTTEAHLALAETLLSAVGQTVRLNSEAQMDAVTGISGSGPAYVFHMIECLTKAGIAEGLPEALALQLAKATVAGAGMLAENSDETPEQLRINVTSPNGTTAAGLEVLMDAAGGLSPLIKKTVSAATARSRALGAD